MDDAWLWSLLFALAIFLSGLIASLGLSNIAVSHNFGWKCLILAPLPLVICTVAWVAMLQPPDGVRRTIASVVGAIAGAVILYGFCELLNKPVRAQTSDVAPQQKESPQAVPPELFSKNPALGEPSISAPNNSGIIAPNNSGTITQYQGPQRLPLGLYQNGQPIGRVEAFSVNAGEAEIVFKNPRLSGGMIDREGSLDFQDFVLSCPALLERINPNAATTSVAILGTISCKIIRRRS